jgi:hypothetical protein
MQLKHSCKLHLGSNDLWSSFHLHTLKRAWFQYLFDLSDFLTSKWIWSWAIQMFTTNQNKQSYSFLHTFLLSPLMGCSFFDAVSAVVASNESSNYGERLWLLYCPFQAILQSKKLCMPGIGFFFFKFKNVCISMQHSVQDLSSLFQCRRRDERGDQIVFQE